MGASTRRHRYLRHRLHTDHPHLGLLAGWSRLARLHSFQHNLDMPEAQFRLACRRSNRLFHELNGMLPTSVRLESAAYAWLAEVS